MILLLARDGIRKNLSVLANPGCSGVPGFSYTQKALHEIIFMLMCEISECIL